MCPPRHWKYNGVCNDPSLCLREESYPCVIDKERKEMEPVSSLHLKLERIIFIRFCSVDEVTFFALLLSDLSVCECRRFCHRGLERYLTVIHTKAMRSLALEGINHRRSGLPSCRPRCVYVCYNDSPPSKASDQEATLEVFFFEQCTGPHGD